MSEAQTQLGRLIEGEGERDAVHVAVAPMEAACLLGPGDHVGRDSWGRADDKVEPKVGIVDPFLVENVEQGERFFVFLYPNTITGLKHRWTHPAFPEESTRNRGSIAESEQWLRAWFSQHGAPGYDDVLDALRNGGSSSTLDPYGDSYGITIYDDYVSVYGTDAHGSIDPQVWDHFEVVLGRRINQRPNHFSCSC